MQSMRKLFGFNLPRLHARSIYRTFRNIGIISMKWFHGKDCRSNTLKTDGRTECYLTFANLFKTIHPERWTVFTIQQIFSRIDNVSKFVPHEACNTPISAVLSLVSHSIESHDSFETNFNMFFDKHFEFKWRKFNLNPWLLFH